MKKTLVDIIKDLSPFIVFLAILLVVQYFGGLDKFLSGLRL